MQTKYINRFLWVYMVLMFFISAYIYGFVLKANGDNVEHLHTSWLIWMGEMPYRDFFQHHNPLTWYLSAPLVAALIDDFSIYSIFNIIGLSTLYVITYYQAKIFLLDNQNKTAALFLAAILVSAYSLLWSTDYRPDTFMFAFFYMGLYYLLVYIQKQKQKLLIISFLCFFISFMFTQKVLLHLIIPGIFLFYWLCIGKIEFKHLLSASLLPIILLALFILFLYSQDALEIYWLSNYPFNLYIPKIFEQQRIVFPPLEYIDFYIFLPVAAVASVYFLIKGSVIERLFCFMFLLETVLRLFYFSAFLHYVIFWLMTAIMLTVMFLSKPKKIYDILCCIGVIYLLFISWYSYHITYKREIKTHQHLNGHEFTFNLLTPCDYALNGYYSTYNLKAKDAGYYAILLGQIDVMAEKAGIRKRDNLNDLIRTKLPKVISGNIYWDTYWEQRGKRIPAHQIDPYLLNTYYDASKFTGLYVLKPQYQKHGCVYNGKEWRYMD